MLREIDLEALPPAPPPPYETLPSEPPPAYSSHLHRVTATHTPPAYTSNNTRWLLANDAPTTSSPSGSGSGTTRSWGFGSGGPTGRSWGEYVVVAVLFTVVVGATIGGALADARARSGGKEGLWA
ncbi:hypothetical protein LTR74_010005 [Friedmanniomyces endolithicus]|nr:hypothetical protein LTR74_010005 [Friedmanniomyces endolithicus]